MPASRPVVLITDHPWPDVDLELELLGGAGFDLVAGPIATPPAATVEALTREHDPVAILCCWAQVSAVTITMPKHLAVVARLGVGLDNIAIEAATARGAWVTNVPDYCVQEVSDHAIALLLDRCRGISAFDREVKLGRWNPASAQLHRIRDMTIGVIGFGRIGSLLAKKLALGFECRVLVHSRSALRHHGEGTELAPHVSVATLHDIQREADAIILTVPLTHETRHLIDDAFLRDCARQPFLVNVSRGGLIDNDALLRALENRSIRGAALDVVDGEPSPPPGLVGRDDVVVTPHVAFSSAASLLELRRRATEDVIRVLKGKSPVHPCNRPMRG